MIWIDCMRSPDSFKFSLTIVLYFSELDIYALPSSQTGHLTMFDRARILGTNPSFVRYLKILSPI